MRNIIYLLSKITLKIEYIFIILTSTLITTMLVNTIISPVYFNFYSLPCSLSVYTMPISCIIINTIAEIFGIYKGRYVLWTSYLITLFAIGVLWVSQLLPTAPTSPVSAMFFCQLLQGNVMLAFGTAIIHFFIQLVAIECFEYLRKLTGSQHIFVRHFCAIILVQLLDTVMTFLCIIGVMLHKNEYLQHAQDTLYYYSIAGTAIIKTVLGLLGIPIVYFFVYLIRRFTAMKSREIKK